MQRVMEIVTVCMAVLTVPLVAVFICFLAAITREIWTDRR